jgi:two-component system alkaline phosphatase synthesis response regulator PhoP
MIYVVEDDNGIRELLLYTLNGSGYETSGFSAPSYFWEAMEKEIPQLILLDIMLPGEDGISVLKKIRANPATAQIPIIMVTAKSAEYDKVEGLDSGADDYITKPFGMMELVSRVKALLRRTVSAPTPALTYGDIEIQPASRTLLVKGEPVTVTLKEFELLQLLLKHPSRVYPREELLEKIWGYTFEGESRTLDVHIRTLRQKLGDYGKYIETVRGIGYKLGEMDHD